MSVTIGKANASLCRLGGNTAPSVINLPGALHRRFAWFRKNIEPRINGRPRQESTSNAIKIRLGLASAFMIVTIGLCGALTPAYGYCNRTDLTSQKARSNALFEYACGTALFNDLLRAGWSRKSVSGYPNTLLLQRRDSKAAFEKTSSEIWQPDSLNIERSDLPVKLRCLGEVEWLKNRASLGSVPLKSLAHTDFAPAARARAPSGTDVDIVLADGREQVIQLNHSSDRLQSLIVDCIQ